MTTLTCSTSTGMHVSLSKIPNCFLCHPFFRSTANDLFTVCKIHFFISCFSHCGHPHVHHFLYHSPDLIHVSRLNSCLTASKKPLHIKLVGVKSFIPHTPPGHCQSSYHCTYQSSCCILSVIFPLIWDWKIILWMRSHVLSSLSYLKFFLSSFTNSKHLVPACWSYRSELIYPSTIYSTNIYWIPSMSQAQS